MVLQTVIKRSTRWYHVPLRRAESRALLQFCSPWKWVASVCHLSKSASHEPIIIGKSPDRGCWGCSAGSWRTSFPSASLPLRGPKLWEPWSVPGPPGLPRPPACCHSSVVVQSCPALCGPTDWSTPGSSILHSLPEFVQLMSFESVMLSNHLVLCRPLLPLPSIFPSIRVFSDELALHIKVPGYCPCFCHPCA